jgi:hypothetical protein
MKANSQPSPARSITPNWRTDRSGAMDDLQADEIRQLRRGQDPEEALDKALDDDAAASEEADELVEENQVEKVAKEDSLEGSAG